MCMQHEICSHVSELLSRKIPGSLYVVVYHHKNQVFFACNGHIFVFRDVKELHGDARYCDTIITRKTFIYIYFYLELIGRLPHFIQA